MAYVTPGTVAAGDVATAAAWNVITNDVIALAVPPTCVMTFTGLTFNNTAGDLNPTFTEVVDNDSMHTTGANNARITINTAGIYIVTHNVIGTAGASTSHEASIFKNGTQVATQRFVTASGTPGASVTYIDSFAVTDYVTSFGNNNGTATLRGNFSAVMIGRT